MDANEFNDAKPVIISVIIALNIVMNSLVIAIIAKYPALRQDCTTLFMCSLSVSDLASGCTTMPVSAAFCSRATPTAWLSTRYLSEVQMFCQWWFGFNSTYSLSWVALSKLITITKPLRHEQILTRKRCYFIIMLNWVVGAALAASKFRIYAQWDPARCVFILMANNVFESALLLSAYIVAGVVPVVALIVTTFMMLVVVFRAHKQIFAQVQSIGGDRAAVSTGLITMQAIWSAKNMIIICLVSVALIVPMFAVSVFLHAIKGRKHLDNGLFSFGAIWLYNINSFMNSFLYIVLYRLMRKKIMHMFHDMRELLRIG